MNLNKAQSYIPSQAYLYFPKSNEVKGNDTQRIIFDGNTQFEKNELQNIEQFRTYAQKMKYTLKPMWTNNMILRFLYANNFKMDKTLASIKEHTTWRETCLPVQMDPSLLSFLNSGLLYIHGRDHKFRPIVIFNIYLLNPKNLDMDLVIKAMTFWFEYIINEWMLPGQIENWVFITNLKGMGIANLAVQSVRKLFAYLQDNYKCRLYSLYVLNTPAAIYIPWQIVKKFLDDVTVKKIQFCKSDIPDNLFTHANREQVEVQFGGSAPTATRFWPPVVPSENYFVSQEDEKVLVTPDEYRRKYHKNELKGMKVSESLIHVPIFPSKHFDTEMKIPSKVIDYEQNNTSNMFSSTKQLNYLLNPTSPRIKCDTNRKRIESHYSVKSLHHLCVDTSYGEDGIEADYVEYMDEKSYFNERKSGVKLFLASFMSELENSNRIVREV